MKLRFFKATDHESRGVVFNERCSLVFGSKALSDGDYETRVRTLLRLGNWVVVFAQWDEEPS